MSPFPAKSAFGPLGGITKLTLAHLGGLARFDPSPIGTKGFWEEKGRDTSKLASCDVDGDGDNWVGEEVAHQAGLDLVDQPGKQR